MTPPQGMSMVEVHESLHFVAVVLSDGLQEVFHIRDFYGNDRKSEAKHFANAVKRFAATVRADERVKGEARYVNGFNQACLVIRDALAPQHASKAALEIIVGLELPEAPPVERSEGEGT